MQTAKAICPNVNMYAEYTDAYVFSQKEDLSFGGNSPLVILKSCGGSMNMTDYLDSGSGVIVKDFSPLE